MIPVGPFLLDDLVGRGGMGEVWRGRHVRSGAFVAVKVIAREHATSEEAKGAFAREVSAAARLDHPGVVAVYDYGVIPAEATERSQGTLLAGSPYFAMDYAALGGLRDHIGRIGDWRACLALVTNVVDGLAHAHARGVVHRDLKPDNVLLFAGDDGLAVKLSDFGIAWSMVAGTDLGAVSDGRPVQRRIGTAHFMAPEQILGTWRDFGPWTDLYALGCTVWMMVCGAPPFLGASGSRLLTAHLYEDPPPLRPLFTVPDGLTDCLLALLAKDPAARYRRAADVSMALRALPEVESQMLNPRRPLDRSFADTRTFPIVGPSVCAAPTTYDLGPAPATDERPLQVSARPVHHAQPQLSAVPGDVALPLPRVPREVGLGLFGLRALPFVGRQASRAVLWESLVEVTQLRRPRVVLLHGASGTGKSRLAQWVCERAHELGVGEVLGAVHGPSAGPSDGLVPAVGRMLRCQGVDPDLLDAHIERMLHRMGVDDPVLVWALASVLRDGTPAVQPQERYGVLRRLIAHLGARRPVVLRLDDVHWSSDSLRFLASLPEATGDCPVLVVATVEDAALQRRPVASRLVERLQSLPTTHSVEVGEMSVDALGTLLAGTVGVHVDLARDIARRCGGNPLFALQLVADLVQRGRLHNGEGGFQLPADAAVDEEMPTDMHDLWSRRLRAVFDIEPPAVLHAFEIAAVLGQEVHPHEWDAACVAADIAAPHAAVALLARHRLTRAFASGNWSFTHGQLAASLRRSAASEGRLQAHHLACATMLAAHPAAGSHGRLGRHLRRAGQNLAAADPLVEAARERRARYETEEARQLLGLWRACLIDGGREPEHVGWAAGRLETARLDLQVGRWDEARQQFDGLLVDAGAYEWPNAVRLAILLDLGSCARMRGESDASGLLRSALVLAGELGDIAAQASCLQGLGILDIYTGEAEEAARRLDRARELYAACGPDQFSSRLQCTRRSAELLVRCQRYAEAEALLREAIEGFRAMGSRFGVASTTNAMGELHRERGDLDSAARLYEDALDVFADLGHPDALAPAFNLGCVLVERGRMEEGRARMEAYLRLEHVPAEGRGVAHVVMARVEAANGRWDEVAEHVDRAESLLVETDYVDRDAALFSEQIAALAAAAGQQALSARVRSMSVSQWTRLGRADEASRAAGDAAASPS